MILDPRIAGALEDIRLANRAIDRAQAHPAAKTSAAVAADLSFARVELSVAAGKLAQIVDEACAPLSP